LHLRAVFRRLLLVGSYTLQSDLELQNQRVVVHGRPCHSIVSNSRTDFARHDYLERQGALLLGSGQHNIRRDEFPKEFWGNSVLTRVGTDGGPWAIQTVPPVLVRIKLK
jgi:hypothetical protein